MQQTKISIGPILFLHYQESLVQSSNLNSKQLRCHGAHPNVNIVSTITVMNAAETFEGGNYSRAETICKNMVL